MVTDTDDILLFLEKRQQELEEILDKVRELEIYRQRQRQLEDLIHRIKTMYNIREQDNHEEYGEREAYNSKAGLGLIPIDGQVYRSIDSQVDIIIKEKGPLRPKDIEHEFRIRGWQLAEKSGLEMIRRALRNGLRKGMYKKLDRNTWDVKS
ncbi:MAG: hypothetical protein ACOC6K_01830 [Thermodesulfobacteriota bacterium]